jgi:hypothetical protein
MIGSLKLVSGSLVLGLALGGAGSVVASAQDTTLQITVQNGRFQPAELHAPVNKGFTIVIKNNDAKPMEFESVSLRVEKVIAAKSQGSVRVRALAPGRYDFFDDFNQANRGTIIVD